MGRYYWGGIDGKFWFGVQPTADLLEFGCERNSDSLLEVVVPFEDLQGIKDKLRTLKKDFRKHGMTFQTFMARENKGEVTEEERRTAEWRTMCREASLISLGEQIFTALKTKKNDLYISGEY